MSPAFPRTHRTSVLTALLLCTLAAPVNAAPVGAPAPDFTLDDQFGNAVTLEDFRGSGVILDFCAVWCGACIDFYENVFSGLDGQELVVPVVLQDASTQTATQADAALWADAFALPQVLHPGGDEAVMIELINDFMIISSPTSVAFPTFVFIDADLTVVANFVGNPGVPGPLDPLAQAVLASQVAVPAPGPLGLVVLALLGLGGLFTRARSAVPASPVRAARPATRHRAVRRGSACWSARGRC